MEKWSGPGRALSVHLDRFDKAHRTARWGQEHHGKEVPVAEYLADPYRDFWLRFSKTYARIELADGVSNSIIREPSDEEMLLTQENVGTAVKLMSLEHQMLNEGTTYYVSEPLVDLVTQAAEAMTEPEPMFATDPPTPSGFAVFERPWLLKDLHPDTGDVVDELLVPVRAIGWLQRPVANPRGSDQTEKPGIVLFFYGDTRSYDEVYVPQLCKYDPDRHTATKLTGRPSGLLTLDVAPWQYGLSWRPVDTMGDYTDDVNDTSNPVMANVGAGRQWMLSFFRLMWQKIIQSDEPHIDRAERRRWEQAGRTLPEDGGIKVLRLRHIERPRSAHFDRGDEYDEYRWRLNHRICGG
jgi:hypothetical protein